MWWQLCPHHQRRSQLRSCDGHLTPAVSTHFLESPHNSGLLPQLGRVAYFSQPVSLGQTPRPTSL